MSVNDRLQEIFRTVLEDDDLVLTDDLTAAEVPSWDSIAHVSLMFTVESAFGLQFADDQLTAFRTVGELRGFIENHAAVQPGAGSPRPSTIIAGRTGQAVTDGGP